MSERGVVVVSVRLEEAPAPERVAAGDDRLVADPNRPQYLVPARRAGKVASRLRAQASGRIPPPRQALAAPDPVPGSSHQTTIHPHDGAGNPNKLGLTRPQGVGSNRPRSTFAEGDAAEGVNMHPKSRFYPLFIPLAAVLVLATPL